MSAPLVVAPTALGWPDVSSPPAHNHITDGDEPLLATHQQNARDGTGGLGIA